MSASGGRSYKDYKFYRCITLNRLISAIGISLIQPELESKIDEILEKAEYRVTKADITHEIRSNHKMTEKVLRALTEDGFILIIKAERGYEIKITKEGILHLRRFNEFYKDLYKRELEDIYRFKKKMPSALRF